MVRVQCPPRKEMGHDRVVTALVFCGVWARRVMCYLVLRQRSFSIAAHSFNHRLRHAVDPTPVLLADVVIEADGKLGFFWICLPIVRGRGGLGDDGGLAVWNEVAVGGDVRDDAVDRFDRVVEGARSRERLTAVPKRVCEEGAVWNWLSLVVRRSGVSCEAKGSGASALDRQGAS